jgi:type I restriction enzyme S subunit
VKRLGRALEKIDERIPGIDLPLMSVSQTRGVIRRSELTDTPQRAESLDAYKVCREGDIVFNKMKIRSGAMGVAREDGLVTYHYEVMRPRGGMDARYIVHLMKSSWFTSELIARERGISAGGEYGGIRTTEVPFNVLRTIEVHLPEVCEQRQIAEYLDRETARIDTLIEEQQRLIEMLSERRVATITEALDGHEMTRLRRVVDPERPMTYGILQCGPLVDGGVVYIGPSDIVGEGRSPARTVLRTTSPEIAAAYQRSVLAGGDLVVSIGPAYGKVAVVSEDLSGGNLTQDTVRVALRRDLAYTRFVVWTLLSRQTSDYWDYEIMGATFRRLNLGTLARTPIPLPSLDEQRRIAVYLDEQTAKIDRLIAETERFIELARERRSALITAAVTGQIDVREAA